VDSRQNLDGGAPVKNGVGLTDTLDAPRFTGGLDSRRFKPLVDADRQEGNRLGVHGTPFFFINGNAIGGGARGDAGAGAITGYIGSHAAQTPARRARHKSEPFSASSARAATSLR
jgi:protein-disulfide isomerase